MLFYTLEHSSMLLFISGDGTVKVRSEFDGAFTGVVHGRKSVDERLEGDVVAIILPIFDGFREEGRFKSAKLEKGK